jgi:hypothetical protein
MSDRKRSAGGSTIAHLRRCHSKGFKLPADFGAGRTHIGRHHPMPANSMGVSVHYIWLVNAAVDAETEHVIADAAAPIRLRRHAHGAHIDCIEMICGLILVDVVVKRFLRAAHGGLLVEPVCRPRRTNTTSLRWSAKSQAKTRRNQCQCRAAPT